jgi:hypothetical protein
MESYRPLDRNVVPEIEGVIRGMEDMVLRLRLE